MRVTTDFWVSALVRRTFAEGGFAAVARRGSTEAGAVMVVLRGRSGEVRLFAPAPQASYQDSRPGDRQFTEIAGIGDDAELEKRLDREARFDSDVWVVEVEADPEIFTRLISVTTP